MNKIKILSASLITAGILTMFVMGKQPNPKKKIKMEDIKDLRREEKCGMGKDTIFI